MRRLPLFGAVAGFAIVSFALLRPAAGQEMNAPRPPGPAKNTMTLHVRIETQDSDATLDGTLNLAGVTLKTETGSQTIEAKFLRRITFSGDASPEAQDTVQTTDKTVIRGRVQDASFALNTGGAVRHLPRAEVREIRVLRPEEKSLFGVILGLVTLAAMEIVLGIDNIIFLAIVAGRLPAEKQPRARKIGLAAALGTRLLLLFSLSFLLGLTTPLFTMPDLPFLHDVEAREVSWRDIILLGGGVFLIGKSVMEMHEKFEESKHAEEPHETRKPVAAASFARVIVTIAVVDIVFSLDSVITAVGMVDELWVMVTAMVIAMLVMMLFAGPIARFVDRHPTIKVLALSFLILIGVMLVVEGLGQHVDKGYIYFAMAFAVVIEMINLRLRKGSAKPTV